VHTAMPFEWQEQLRAGKYDIDFGAMLAGDSPVKHHQFIDGELLFGKGPRRKSTMPIFVKGSKRYGVSLAQLYPGQGALFAEYVDLIQDLGQTYGDDAALFFDRLYRSRAVETSTQPPDWQPGFEFYMQSFQGGERATLCWCGGRHLPADHDDATTDTAGAPAPAHHQRPAPWTAPQPWSAAPAAWLTQPPPQDLQGMRAPTAPQRGAGPGGTTPCGFFNKPVGCKKTAATCGRTHVCDGCGGPHPRTHCPTSPPVVRG